MKRMYSTASWFLGCLAATLLALVPLAMPEQAAFASTPAGPLSLYDCADRDANCSTTGTIDQYTCENELTCAASPNYTNCVCKWVNGGINGYYCTCKSR